MLFDDSVLVIGGRNSPHKPCGKVYSLTLSEDQGEWHEVQLHHMSDYMVPRWRHSATTIEYAGKLR